MELAISVLITSRYAPARGGHAPPGDRQDAALEALDLVTRAPFWAPPPTGDLSGALGFAGLGRETVPADLPAALVV